MTLLPTDRRAARTFTLRPYAADSQTMLTVDCSTVPPPELSQSRRLRALVFVDSDVVVRHFLNSGALTRLSDSHDVTLVLPPPGNNRLKSPMPDDMWGLKHRRVALPEVRRSIWRRLFFVDQSRWRFGSDWANVRRGWRAMIGWKAAIQFGVYALPGIRHIVQVRMRRRLDVHPPRELDALLDEMRPDILVHPSTFDGYFINDVIEAAARRSIPSLLLMNSWDNPSLKRAVIGKPDAVVVWGEQTRRHTERFMGMASNRVHVLGAAQFDVYRHAPTIDRATICLNNGIAPANMIVMYAGSSKGNREARHLELLSAHLLASGRDDVTILYRAHPYGLRCDDARRILDRPLPNVVLEQSTLPLLEKVARGEADGFHITPYEHTHALLSAIDALISPLSTILLEAALHGKPVMCFIPWEDDRNSIWRTLRDLIYFRELYESSAVILARSYDEYLTNVDLLLDRIDDPRTAAETRAAMRTFVEFPDQPYSEGLVALTEALCGSIATRA